MKRVLILGNSGSGKTSLAKRLSKACRLPHLDLDTVAWRGADPPERETFEISSAAINDFMSHNPGWVMEGCYASLISHAAQTATQMVFLNIGIEACIKNCKSRPWEPDKYPTKEAQDKNLAMLIEWVSDYLTREDDFSLQEHLMVFESFQGEKCEIRSNEEAQSLRVDTNS